MRGRLCWLKAYQRGAIRRVIWDCALNVFQMLLRTQWIMACLARFQDRGTTEWRWLLWRTQAGHCHPPSAAEESSRYRVAGSGRLGVHSVGRLFLAICGLRLGNPLAKFVILSFLPCCHQRNYMRSPWLPAEMELRVARVKPEEQHGISDLAGWAELK